VAVKKAWIDTVPASVVGEVDVQVVAFMAEKEAECTADLREVVEIAKHNGFTWEQIGLALGTSKSAAYQRFGKQDTTAWRTWRQTHARIVAPLTPPPLPDE
jgi:hypothetical protein